MLKKYLILLVSVLGGLCGFILRTWQFNTAFEPMSGLPIAGTAAGISITLFSLLIAALLMSLAILQRRSPLEEPRPHAPAPSFLALLFTCAAAALTAVSAFLFFQESLLFRQIQQRTDLLLFLFALLGFFSAYSLCRIGMLRYKGTPVESSASMLCPAFSACLWLMVSYQVLAGDPFVADYVFALFAIMSGMLAHYFIAAHAFQAPRCEAICVAAGLSIYFSLISLAGGSFTAHSCLFLAQILYFIPTLLLLLRNDVCMQSTAAEESHSTSDFDEQTFKEETP